MSKTKLCFNPYEILGIHPSSSEAEIKSAYRKQAIIHHPDKGGDEEHFIKIKQAYDILTNVAEGDIEYEEYRARPVGDVVYYGSCPADDLKELFESKKQEFEGIVFNDNFAEYIETLNQYVKSQQSLPPRESKTVRPSYVCDICAKAGITQFKSKQQHNKYISDDYDKYISYCKMSDTQIDDSILSIVSHVDPDIKRWSDRFITSSQVNLPPPISHNLPPSISHNTIVIFSNLDHFRPIEGSMIIAKDMVELINRYMINGSDISSLTSIQEDTFIKNFKNKIKNHTHTRATPIRRYGHQGGQIKIVGFEQHNNDDTIISFLSNIVSGHKIENDTRICEGVHLSLCEKNQYYFPISTPVFITRNPPAWDDDDKHVLCNYCKKSFNIFIRKHHCRMCGKVFCSKCLWRSHVPQLGYVTVPVKICNPCNTAKLNETIALVIDFISQNINDDYLDRYFMFLHILCGKSRQLHAHETHNLFEYTLFNIDKDNTDRTRDALYYLVTVFGLSYNVTHGEKKIYTVLKLTYLRYGMSDLLKWVVDHCDLNTDIWSTFGDRFLADENLDMTYICYTNAVKQFRSIGDIIISLVNDKCISDDDSLIPKKALTLLLVCSGSSYKNLNEYILHDVFKCIKISDSNIISCVRILASLCVVYNNCFSNVWVNLINTCFSPNEEKLRRGVILFDGFIRTSTIMGSLPKILREMNEGWGTVRNIVRANKIFSVLARYADYVYRNKSSYSFENEIDLYTRQIGSPVPSDGFDLALFYILRSTTERISWITIRDNYIKEYDRVACDKKSGPTVKKILEHVCCCHALSKILENNLQTWGHVASLFQHLQQDDFINLHSMDPTKPNWEDIADRMFREKKYDSAIMSYNNMGKDKFTHIQRKIHELLKYNPQTTEYVYAARYTYFVYKLCNYKIPMIVKLCEMVPNINDTIIVTKRTILGHAIAVNNRNYDAVYRAFAETINDTQKNVLIGLYHKRYPDDYFVTYIKNENLKYYETLKETVYSMDCKAIGPILEQMNPVNASAANKFYNEQIKNNPLQNTPKHYRVLLLLVKARIDKINRLIADSFDKIQDCLKICISSNKMNDVLLIISSMLKSNQYHSLGLKRFLDQIESLTTNDPMLNLTIPQFDENNQDVLKPTIYLKAIRSYEDCIFNNLDTDLDKGFWYSNMPLIGMDRSCLINTILSSCIFFISAMKKTDVSDVPSLYALKSLIDQFTTEVYVINDRFSNPYITYYVLKIIIALQFKAVQIFRNAYINSGYSKKNRRARRRASKQEDVISKTSILVTAKSLETICGVLKLFPFAPPLHATCFDLIHSDFVQSSYISEYLKIMSSLPSSNQHIYQYLSFDGLWKGWLRVSSSDDNNVNDDNNNHDDDRREIEKFNNAKAKCMESLLEGKKWYITEIEHIMNWPFLVRSKAGWLSGKKNISLNLPGTTYSRVLGVVLNSASGEIKYLFEKDRSLQQTFNNDDVSDVMRSGVIGAIFTLDPPDHKNMPYHPFQEMKFAPKSISRTNYLATLLHTDYLLKEITSGVEVHPEFPFGVKQSDTGFMMRLPKRLREGLKPLHMRRSSSINISEAHRFWIEAGPIYYETKRNGDSIEYRFSDVQMFVRTHPLKTDDNGNLVDDEQKDATTNMTPEREFATFFTENYDEIGNYFPELLRLKELVKLSAIALIIRNTYSQIKQYGQEYKLDDTVRKKVGDHLMHILCNVEYPLTTENTINQKYNDYLEKCGISPHDVWSHQEQELKDKIREALEEQDELNYKTVLDNIAKSYGIDQHNIEHSVRSFLVDKKTSSLCDVITYYIKENNRDSILRFCREIDNIGINCHSSDNEFTFDTTDHESCTWVPSAFFNYNDRQKNIKIYGGVNLQVNLKQGSGSGDSGSGGSGGRSGGSGGTGSSGPRYVTTLRPDGKVTATVYARNAITGTTSVYATGNSATNPNASTQAYWKPYGTTVEHYTRHRDGAFHVHDHNGTRTRYK